jgi:hypothetical protein
MAKVSAIRLGDLILQVNVKPNENDPNLLILTIKDPRGSIPEREVMGVVQRVMPGPAPKTFDEELRRRMENAGKDLWYQIDPTAVRGKKFAYRTL